MDLNPPSWCPDAILTPLGWSHPQTGEVLVANRLLKPAYDQLNPNLKGIQYITTPVIIPEPIETLSEPVSKAEPIETGSTDKIVQAVSALDDTKPRGRPKTKP